MRTVGQPHDERLVVPDYAGAWIGAVLPALAATTPPAWLPRAAAQARTVVLVVLDGLGRRLLDRHARAAPTLTSMSGATITSTIPSTTVAGLTSITTAVPPSRHGMVGYRFRAGGTVLSPLAWTTPSNTIGPPDPHDVQPVEPFAAGPAPVVVVNRAAFRGTGFTVAHLRGPEFVAVSDGDRSVNDAALVDPLALVAATRDAVGRAGLVYAYDDRIDKAAHHAGVHSDEVAVCVAEADRLVARLLDGLPDEVAVVVTADHGQLDVTTDALIDLAPLADQVASWAGEARVRHLHAAPGASASLLAAARRLMGDAATVLSGDEFVASGLLGQRPTLAVRSRVGDVVVLARGRFGTVAPDLRLEARLRSMHGGQSPDEMLVPLLAARGRAPRGRGRV